MNAERPGEADQQAYYRNDYALAREELATAGQRAAYIAAERRRWSRLPEQLSLVADLLRFIQPPATLLDVGCDHAFFLDEARRHGFAVVGVEPSDRARAAAQAIGVPMHSSLDAITQQVRGITVWHVLEHVADPMAFLRSLHAKLEAGGVIAVRVPDFTCLPRRALGARWPWFQPRNHLLHFSATALRRALEGTGFAVRHLVRRRPSNLLTLMAGAVSARSFARHMGERRGWHARLAPLAHYLALVEIYAIGVKKGFEATDRASDRRAVACSQF
jgi:SAM-dependent methyltransferase